MKASFMEEWAVHELKIFPGNDKGNYTSNSLTMLCLHEMESDDSTIIVSFLSLSIVTQARNFCP